MPEGSRVGGFPVMEPVEQSSTGRRAGGGIGQRRTGTWNEEAQSR